MIGTGAFANVFHGSFQGRAVAVKMLLKSRTSTVSQIQSFVHEIQLMSQFDSPYIVNLVGAAWTRPSDLQCVMEFMDGGDLKEYLDTHSSQEFAWADKYVHLLSIADGLCYLHSMNVIHRDVKSRNVLLDSTKGTKLTDFGISKEDIQATRTVGVGTFRWMAPEVLQDQGYTISADIYSFDSALCLCDALMRICEKDNVDFDLKEKKDAALQRELADQRDELAKRIADAKAELNRNQALVDEKIMKEAKKMQAAREAKRQKKETKGDVDTAKVDDALPEPVREELRQMIAQSTDKEASTIALKFCAKHVKCQLSQVLAIIQLYAAP
ncbi:hypothetical protein DYB38_012600, partial [Aphanomyces astaci]